MNDAARWIWQRDVARDAGDRLARAVAAAIATDAPRAALAHALREYERASGVVLPELDAVLRRDNNKPFDPARQRGGWKSHRRLQRERLAQRDGPLCRACDRASGSTVDHIWPRSKGGCDCDENCELLCPSCNQRKGDAVVGRGHRARACPRRPVGG